MATSGQEQWTAPAIRRGGGWPLPSWPLIVALLAFLWPLRRAAALFNDPDTYLHIGVGRWIIAHRALPFHDPFSHSMAGASWVPHEWLAEVVLAAGYGALGWSGLSLLTVLCFAASLALLTRRLLDHFEPFGALILAMTSAALLLPHLLARPHILALPAMVVWCAGVIAARDRGAGPPWALLPVMAVWANLHGSFMAGIALAFILGLEAVYDGRRPRPDPQALRRWGSFVLLAGAAALVTPNGIAGLLLPLRLVGMTTLQSSFVEWLSPNFQEFQPLELWLLGALAVALMSGLTLPRWRVVVLLGLFHAALAHRRHSDLVAVIAPLIVAKAWGPALAARIRTAPPSGLARWFAALAPPAGRAWQAGAAGLVLLAAALLLQKPEQRGDGPATPGTAVAVARGLGLTGPVFNQESFGGYLLFSGVPTFIDGRIEMYGDAFLARYLAAEAGREPALSQLLDHYRIEWTLLDPRMPAVAALDHLPGWRRVWSDPVAVIHRRVKVPG